MGVFHSAGAVKDLFWQEIKEEEGGKPYSVGSRAGLRICPNVECSLMVFVFTERDQVVSSFPPEIIDFDATELPTEILASLREAITCHAAGAYRASALMVRRTLEELCADKGAEGENLYKRIAALKAVALVPQDLLEAAHELRLLGNDAAHLEAKTYDSIGKDEAGLAIELAKELLKAVYQYKSLVDKLRALKRT
ncbi:DUF4145 domain-containing protein [Methylorubrum aminovorans]|uniref:DUF4145 domain-containing protein n=1 Tax=Methylorubrum aminovorans TaxID=269069 RepID=UPI003C2C091A